MLRKMKVAAEFAVVGLVLAAGAAAVGYMLHRHGELTPAARGESPADAAAGAIPVKAIRPRVDPSFEMTVTQPCYVEPYYRVRMAARVAGPVVWFPKDIGDRVRKGEPLLVIDVPDQVADLAKKDALVTQRVAELEVARAMTEKAQADVDIARTAIKEADAMVRSADATTSFRYQELKRFEGMAKDGAVTENVVAERKKYYEAAEAESMRARASSEKANSDLKGALAKLKEAQADEKYKQSMIEVAKRDREVAKAFLDYATVRAPWDGVITERKVNPGSFVRSSATGEGEPLLTLERSDIVTVGMALPDNYAPFVEAGTQAQIEMSELPGLVIRGQVSRFAPSLINSANDRTMRVELDLWNGKPADFAKFIARERANNGAGLKGGVEPILPEVQGGDGAEVRLTPGMYGNMKLVLKKFGKVCMLPSAAVFTQGGKSYVYVVQSGVARRFPVDVQVDDGKVVKVVLLETDNGREVRRELTANDVIVYTNQGELSDGQPVKATLTSW
jgi:multidrug resistance efflux pump